MTTQILEVAYLFLASLFPAYYEDVKIMSNHAMICVKCQFKFKQKCAKLFKNFFYNSNVLQCQLYDREVKLDNV